MSESARRDAGAPHRYSGHESFICRYGWLPKAYRAVASDRALLRSEEPAMRALGIGRNMLRSMQFWCEATGILQAVTGGHAPGPIGRVLLDPERGWDPHLESPESLWLLHWRLCSRAHLAAWAEVFVEGRLMCFDRSGLIAALARRGEGAARPLAQSTLEQHAAVFLQTYALSERSGDDTSWSPLQDLALLRAEKRREGGLTFNAEPRAPVGLSLRVFSMALLDFAEPGGRGEVSVGLQELLRGRGSPGLVFRLDERLLRAYLDNAARGPLQGALRFVNTLDTQAAVIRRDCAKPEYLLQEAQEDHAHA